jgi:hypothetical protein
LAGILTVQTIQGPTSGANANKVIIPAGQTLDASAGGVTLPAGVGGKILQVVSFHTTTQTQTTSTSFIDTQITTSITPSATSSKVLAIVSVPVDSSTGSGVGASQQIVALFRGATQLTQFSHGTREGANGVDYHQTGSHISYLDAPSSTSAVTYIVKVKSNSTSTTITCPISGDGANIILMEIAG